MLRDNLQEVMEFEKYLKNVNGQDFTPTVDEVNERKVHWDGWARNVIGKCFYIL